MRSATVLRKADEAEAAEYLRAARNSDELVSLWWRFADHHSGETRERLQTVYAERLAKFAPMQRAG